MFRATCFGQFLSLSSGSCTVYIKEKVHVAYAMVKYFRYIVSPDVHSTLELLQVFVSHECATVSDTVGKIVTYYRAPQRSGVAFRDFVVIPCGF